MVISGDEASGRKYTGGPGFMDTVASSQWPAAEEAKGKEPKEGPLTGWDPCTAHLSSTHAWSCS